MRWWIFVVAILVGGCDQIDAYIVKTASKDTSQRDAALEAKIASLDRNLNQKEAEITELKSEIASLKISTEIQDSIIANINQSSATIADGGGYGIARTNLGVFTVSMEKIEPYLDGYRATLSIGNPSGLRLHGGEFQVEWGLPWGTKNKTPAEIYASKRSNKFSIVKDFLPWAYTNIEVALTPAKPEEVKRLTVGVAWNQISLRKPSN